MLAIVVIFALLEDQLVDNQHYYRFLLQSFEFVYKFIQHISLSRLLLKSLVCITYKNIYWVSLNLNYLFQDKHRFIRDNCYLPNGIYLSGFYYSTASNLLAFSLSPSYFHHMALSGQLLTLCFYNDKPLLHNLIISSFWFHHRGKVSHLYLLHFHYIPQFTFSVL